VTDTNTPFLIRELYSLGVQVRRLVVVPDCLEQIAHEVQRASREFDIVLTSGGVGPTHDDITYEGIAKAFGIALEEHPDLRRQLEAHFRDRLNEATLKMARIPAGATLNYAEPYRFPLVVVRNVHIFPGVPELLRARFLALRDRFRTDPFFLVRIFTRQEESALARHLEATLSACPGIEIGSYPRFDSIEYKVMVTLESKESGLLLKARDFLLARLEPLALVRVESPEDAPEVSGDVSGKGSTETSAR
jgi:FAD synthetase